MFDVLTFAALAATLGIPATPHSFVQRVDHFSASNATFQQRYYLNDTSASTTSPPVILVIMGGEGAIPPSTGFFYPFVIDVLAPKFGALVVEPEHRFYGESLPFGAATSYDLDHLRLLTPMQALADTADLIRSVQRSRNCSLVRGSPGYCPVFTIGGSYPGWMSAMMRLRYPAVVDGAYAASAPMNFYAQRVDQYDYYTVIKKSADRAKPGCSQAVRDALALITAADLTTLVKQLNLCQPLPSYMAHDVATLRDEILMVYSYSFAGLNMANYPPGPGASLTKACELFMEPTTKGTWAPLKAFLGGAYARFGGGTSHPAGRAVVVADDEAFQTNHTASSTTAACVDLSKQLPAGRNATITCGDWSGCGVGTNGLSWDYETCSFLVEVIGTDGTMFPKRPWTLDWLNKHCAARFGVVPAPTLLNDEWGFDAESLVQQGASHILFTNGLNDGWSAGGFVKNLSLAQDLLVLNMPNGAHHSDLRHSRPCPGPDDTEDVLTARSTATAILERWVSEIRRA